MNHDEAWPLLAAYADDELPTAQRSWVERHVTGCADCRAELAALSALQRGVRRALKARAETVEAPAHTWAELASRPVGEPGLTAPHLAHLPRSRNHPGLTHAPGGTRALRLFSLGFALLAALAFIWLVIVMPLVEGSLAASKRKTPTPPASPTTAVPTPVAGSRPGVRLLSPTRLPDGIVYMADEALPGGGQLTTFYNRNDDRFLTVRQVGYSLGDPLPGGGDLASVGGLAARLQTGQKGTLHIPGPDGRSIDYQDAVSLTWQTPFGTRLTLLSNLPRANVLDFAPSLAVTFTQMDLSVAPAIPDEGFATRSQVAVNNGLLMTESHFFSEKHFVVLTQSLDIGHPAPQGEPVGLSSGVMAVLARGQSGTAPADSDAFFPGLAVTVLGGGGGGGGGPDDVQLVYPKSITFANGIRLSWTQEGTWLDLLSNLPEEDVLKMAGGLQPGRAFNGPLITGAFIDRSIMPRGGAMGGYVISRPALPDDFYGQWNITVAEGQGLILENRYFSNSQFAVITTWQAGGGPLPAGEPVMIGGRSGVIETGRAGTALLNTREYDSTLQDGKPRLVLGMSGGDGTGVKNGIGPDLTWPDKLDFRDGFLVTWTLDGARLTLLTNLSREQALQAAADVTILGKRYDVINPVSGNDQDGFFADGFDLYAPLYLPDGMVAIAPGSDTEGKSDILFWNPEDIAQFVLVKERAARPGEKIVTSSGTSLSGGPALVEQVAGSLDFRYGPQPGTIRYQQATRITWIAGGTWLQILANLPRDQALKIAESMEKGQ